MECTLLVLGTFCCILLSPSAADARSVHASTIVVDGGGTPSPVGGLVNMPVEDGPGGGGRKKDIVES